MATQERDCDRCDESVGMAERIRRFDWASTPLGAIETWPADLKFLVRLLEGSSFPKALYWGPDLILLYNDAWAPIPGERHPAALGRPASEVWHDIWPIIEPQFREVIATGKGIALYEQHLPMLRGGQVEETWWNYSFTPVMGADGAVQGILNQGDEITATVNAERRLSFQVRLADELRRHEDPREVKSAAAALLGTHLGVARVGFAEIDEGRGRLEVRRDWVKSEQVAELVGRSIALAELPATALEMLRRGETIALSDVASHEDGGSDGDKLLGERLGVRAVITVPLVRDGRLRGLLFVHEEQPRSWRRAEVAMARDTAERTWAAFERTLAEQGLRDSEDHHRNAVELNPQVSWTSWPDGQLNRVSKRWEDWTGTTGLGSTWAEGLHPDDRQRTFDVWSHSVSTGEPYDIEHRVQFRDGSYRWARSRAFPRRDEHGAILLWYGTTEDIHDRKLAEERQRLLINELNHRVKNTLATVQAIAFQTLKGEISVEEGRARFEARLLALSRAHNLLTDKNWEGASLRRVIADSTEHLAGPQRIDVEGPRIWVAPRAALALALAFHELSTNAAKYGALSAEAGSIRITWATEHDRLRLTWKEQGGPPVAQPSRRGFGSRLIQRGLAADLGGSASLVFEADGLRCDIEASLAAIQARETDHG
jgi:PAS domain S-box-containing protein